MAPKSQLDPSHLSQAPAQPLALPLPLPGGAISKSAPQKKAHQILLYPDQMSPVSAGSLIGLTPIAAQSIPQSQINLSPIEHRVIAAYVIIVCMVILLILLLLKMFVDRSRWSQEAAGVANSNSAQGTLRSQIYGEYQGHYEHYGQVGGRNSHLDDVATLQNHQNIYKSRTSLCTSLNPPGPLNPASLNPPPPYTISHTNPYAYFNGSNRMETASNTNSIYKYYCVLAANQASAEGGPT